MFSKKLEDEKKLVPKESFLKGKKYNSKPLLAWLSGIILVIFVVSFVLLVYLRISFVEQRDCVGGFYFDHQERKVYLSNGENKWLDFGHLGRNLGDSKVVRRPTENGFEYAWDNGLKLLLEDIEGNCTYFSWLGLEQVPSKYLWNCFFRHDERWYGGGEMYNQVWPLDKAVVKSTAYFPQDVIALGAERLPGFGPVLGRYWLTSSGISILVNETIPLVVSLNEERDWLCLTIDPNLYPSGLPIQLDWTVCHAENVKTAHKGAVQRFFKKLQNGPDEKMIRDPVWSTWVRFGKSFTQSDIEVYLSEIVASNISCSQIEIDDKYSTKYGDYNFDPERFPDAVGMIEKIHAAGCRVTTWVHPFAEVFSEAYAEGANQSFFVTGAYPNIPGLCYWWNGIAASVDFTKPSAYDWFLTRLKDFQNQYNIDSFKFDAGSMTYLPYQYTLNGTKIPSHYSVKYAELASEIGNMAEVRVADQSQDLSVFVRILDRESSWGLPLGLQSVIPTVLTFGILGYPFVLPDMIGGNGKASKELFIRWMQLNAFLPAMQFSMAPWDYDNETMAIAHNVMSIRKAILPAILKGVNDTVSTGDPIIRPMWWIAPEDKTAQAVDQAFMVTDEFLVAPVVTPGAQEISVYLPRGSWMEQFGERHHFILHEGRYVTYNVTLKDVFYFKNMNLKQLY